MISSVVFPCEYVNRRRRRALAILPHDIAQRELGREENDPHDHERQRELTVDPSRAAEAPTGNHHVLATKKYVLTRVISQIKTINARPIPTIPPIPKATRKDFPTAVAAPHSASNSRRRVYHSRARKSKGLTEEKIDVHETMLKKSIVPSGELNRAQTRKYDLLCEPLYPQR